MNRIDRNCFHENCIALLERLSEYIDEELEGAVCTRMEIHIKSCKPCQVCLATLRQTVNLCRHLEHHPVPEPFSLKLKAAVSDLVRKHAG